MPSPPVPSGSNRPAALVTGATGFIAFRLVPALVEAGWSVLATGRRPRPVWLPTEVGYRTADLVEDDLSSLTAGITHVFHLAGASSSKSDEEEMQRANVVGTTRLLEALPPGIGRFVHMSTTAVYGEEVQLPLPVSEDVELHPSRGYGKAKLGAEEAVWAKGEAGLPVVVLRPVSVFGPGAVKLLASVVLDAAIEAYAGLDHLAVPAEPIEQRLLHVDDLVDACIHLAGEPDAVGRAFNVASLYPGSHELGEAVASAMGLRLETDPEARGLEGDERRQVYDRMREAGMTDDIVLSPERMRLLGKTNRNNRLSGEALASTGFEFSRTDLAAEVAADVAWYRERRWIL